MKKGIDISYHQGKVDFNAVKNSGIDFVILREGYRNSVDPKFFEYVEQAKSVGIYILGVYHFSYALNVEEAIKEARLCIDNVNKARLDPHVSIFFDFEYDTVKKAKEKGIILTKKECNEHTVAFCEEIKRLARNVGIYTNIDYYKNWYNKDVLSKYDIWLADYKGKPDYSCIIQQYSDKGSVSGIKGPVDLDYFYNEEYKKEEKTMKLRMEVVKLAVSWIGKKEADGTHKEIIDIYNSYKGKLPRGIKMTYTAPWCACTWSALAIKLGYTDIMPIEISCGELIKKAKEMGIWKESDDYTALPGDAILYDWDDDGIGDNTGWPDHVGVIEKVSNGVFTVIEGNKNDVVGRRRIPINGKYIRGFITPNYDADVKEKEDPSNKKNTSLKKDKWVVTAANSLNCREKPDINSGKITIFKNGTELDGTGKTEIVNDTKWVEVKVPKTTKTGWCSEGSNGKTYLKKI